MVYQVLQGHLETWLAGCRERVSRSLDILNRISVSIWNVQYPCPWVCPSTMYCCGYTISSLIPIKGASSAPYAIPGEWRKLLLILDAAFASLGEKAREQTTPFSRNNRNSELSRRVRLLVEKENSSRPAIKKTGREDAINATATVV